MSELVLRLFSATFLKCVVTCDYQNSLITFLSLIKNSTANMK